MAIKNLLFVFIVLYAADSAGAVYKCTDASGHAIYSDTACDNKTDRQSVEVESLAEVKNEESFLSGITEKFKRIFQSTSDRQRAESIPKVDATANKPLNYKCDGRTHCSQMTSCEEAIFSSTTVRALKWMATMTVFRARSSGVDKS